MWSYKLGECICLKPFASLLRLILLLSIGMMTCDACGHYMKVDVGGSATIASGSSYGAYTNCIWWLETQRGSQLSISVTYVGDVNLGRCGDYLIIKDDKTDDSKILDLSETCTSLTNHVVTAKASWMQVQFKSDGVNTTAGFQGTVSSTFIGDTIRNYSNPIDECRSYEWGCENKVCMTMSYRCDGFNDCGCDDGCDEHSCGGMGIDKYTIMIIGGCVGFVVFIVFFFFAFAFERHLKTRALLADPEAQADLQRKKADKKRKEAYQKAVKEKKDGWA